MHYAFSIAAISRRTQLKISHFSILRCMHLVQGVVSHDQVYPGKSLLQPEHTIAVRFFAKNPSPHATKGDVILGKDKITSEPNVPAVVQRYAKAMKSQKRLSGMENFRWKDGTLPPRETLTPRFRLSEEQAPRLSEVLSPEQVPLPVIDMATADEDALVAEMARASADFGFFIITNHGIDEGVWERAAESVRGVFMLPPEVKSQFPGEGEEASLFSYFLYDWPDQRKVDMWLETLNHSWHPDDDFTDRFPPHLRATYGYRENVLAYANVMGGLMRRLLNLLSRGLGLEDNYLEENFGEPRYKAASNYFPPCPEPDHAIGLPIHSDSLMLGVVRSIDDVPGLQIQNVDPDWVEVNQLPNSFVVNIGDQLEVLSNRRYRSVDHRVVTNDSRERLSLAYFWGPNLEATIGPIDNLVDDEHPLVYNSYKYKEFMEMHGELKGKRRKVKEFFLVNPR